MKILRLIACIMMAALVLGATSLCAQSMLIIDTENMDLYGYDRLIQRCEQAGFETKAMHFYDIHGDLNDYDAILLCLHSEMFKSPEHPIVQPLIKNIMHFAQTPHKLLMFGLPSLSVSEQSAQDIEKFMKELGLTDAAGSADLKSYLALNVTQQINYPTMLQDAGKISMVGNNEPNKISFPIGHYLNNREHNNHIYITRCPVLLFDAVAENFFIDPIDSQMRSQLVDMEQQALNELGLLIKNKPIKNTAIQPRRAHPELIVLRQAQDERRSERDNSIRRKDNINVSASKIAAAWMAPDAFDGDEILKKQIDHIADANLNLLWFNLSPELYLSVNASQPKTKELQLSRIRNITRALKKKYAELGRPVPAIYLGVEITGNLRTAKVKEPMVDIFGNVYDKIPAPFDSAGFWKPEFFDVFDTFVGIWEKDVGNGLPLAGIFFDFEMYHAQKQAGSFPALADFSPTSMNLYEKTNLAPREFALKLFKEHKLDDYFATLKHQAFLLGRKIRNHVQARLPNAQFAAYFPNVSADWFYMGMFAGLSTPAAPLILATFNTSVEGHEAWLQKNNIYIRHLAAILLSKFQNLDSFSLIDALNKINDGVWYNRFSWMAHPYDPKAWWAIESTPFDHDLVSREIGRHHPKAE